MSTPAANLGDFLRVLMAVQAVILTLQVSLSDVVKQQIVDAYKTDAFCQEALNNIASVTSEFKIIDALLYLRGRLVIPLLAPVRMTARTRRKPPKAMCG
ncbi:BZ3500_MvSof-1268-A1-R1_Chr5-1g07659 [Microbotryum saponariae]|uniref:BZ3500_MvSof-1268-A1-R1_Chr5-1g07659 protein n=1 Tax=Microbotryum saponariae TaxID=289078 RepID=A0A2X0LF33_9BASI|nr:BZ3500_MvSof-1268-A1-R1_Chr5-1g07659 [Microbotryum saponariae]SDA05531.1 BZ3501_MvSof-1269-A2-R1_Chr5-2g07484 [Microbotryum saponariae]